MALVGLLLGAFLMALRLWIGRCPRGEIPPVCVLEREVASSHTNDCAHSSDCLFCIASCLRDTDFQLPRRSAIWPQGVPHENA
ncbi:hypothetical protein DFH94DRAFT_727625 [Russula ochroleuca]|uniref:Secreted protein n=1 Tax=Russula ochroleuca TaxID=152965 RepID=A0A9P5JU19_9AGAM|nr:hypothetical protein DFH94DRAFT_789077 [Russula ochroleuca]KAF8482507.1 hypothetical protein DFH94DRAFT_727625 [Russula ochroleuca]